MTNPWADAAASKRQAPHEPGTPRSAAAGVERYHSQSCQLTTLRSVVRLLHVLDALVGLLFIVYGILLVHHKSVLLAMSFSVAVGTLLLFRAAVGTASIHSDLLLRCGLQVSATVCPVLALLWGTLSVTLMFNHSVVLEYLQEHETALHLSGKFLSWLQAHRHALWVTLLVSSVLEVIRWRMVKRLQKLLLQVDTQLFLQDDPPPSSKRPWWWQTRRRRQQQQDTDLEDPLLTTPHWTSDSLDRNYSMHHGTTTSPQSFFSRWFSSAQKEDADEPSFASVQEEWASRSEEDPFWWTKEDDQVPASATKTREEKTTNKQPNDTSWAHENDDKSTHTENDNVP